MHPLMNALNFEDYSPSTNKNNEFGKQSEKLPLLFQDKVLMATRRKEVELLPMGKPRKRPEAS